MSRERDIIDERERAARNSGLDPDVTDLTVDEILNGSSASGGPGIVPDPPTGPPKKVNDNKQLPDNIDDYNALELFEAVMKRGSVIFGDGRMLTKCPAYSSASICGMYPMPDIHGNPAMVCTGPTIQKRKSGGLLFPERTNYKSRSCHGGCPYNPHRLEDEDRPDPSQMNNSSSSDDDGNVWL